MTKKKSNNLFELFAGEYVNITTKAFIERSVTTEKSIETLKSPITIQGYLVEADDFHYYLGIAPDRLNQAVSVSEVLHIEVTDEQADVMEQLLESGEVPPEDKFN